jgi:hypothetical protein
MEGAVRFFRWRKALSPLKDFSGALRGANSSHGPALLKGRRRKQRRIMGFMRGLTIEKALLTRD